jgi:hypothetical protein
MTVKSSSNGGNAGWPLLWPFLFLAAIGGVFFIQNTHPVYDGDMFWRMAYGRYILEHRTLIPDQTVFTWTDSSKPFIYCAWIIQVLYYLVFSFGGFAAIFAVRYRGKASWLRMPQGKRPR